MSPNVIKKIFIKEKIMEEMMEDVVEETTVSKKPVGKLDKFFGITERGSTLRTEIFAGITTFFAMCYIVLVNPSQIAADGANGWLAGIIGSAAAGLGQVYNAVFVGSILATVIGTLLMAFVAKMPFAQAAGMGLNSFFCTCFVSAGVFAGQTPVDSYQGGLIIIFISGIIFLLLSVTGLRQYIAKALPDCLKKAIPAGIGLFIAFIGFKNSGIVVADRWTFVGLVDLTKWEFAAPALAAFIGLIIIGILGKFKFKGNIIVGILISAVLYYLFTWQLPSFEFTSLGTIFSDFGTIGVTALFTPSAWNFAFGHVGVFNAICYIITFCLIDMFDTIGTLFGTASQANMLDENGDPINLDQCMLCDSIGTVAGAMLGTSTITTFVESSAGVAAGGRTGLASVVTAACFLLCLFVSPFASIIPTVATAPALIYVGVLMLSNFAKVDLSDITNAIPAFLALVLMPLTYSIANGIGVGAISYVLLKLFTGKYTKQDIVVTIIAAIFVVRFILTFTGTYPVYA